MDLIKIGKFIAALRKQQGLTQEQLGERLGVTGKTVSRWETGSYLPPVEMLKLLGEEFHLTINELLAGERLSDRAFREKADENLLAAVKSSAFSSAEQKAYWTQKWRKEHKGLFAALILLGLLAWVIPFAVNSTFLLPLAALFNMAEYGWQNNRMMVYVENHLYGGE